MTFNQTNMFAYVTTEERKCSAQLLASYERHGRREDDISLERNRDGVDPLLGFDFPKALSPGVAPAGQHRRYRDAWKAHAASQGATVRKGAPAFSAHLVGVSVDWVKEAGGLHDPRNPRNRQLFKAAVLWAQEWSGGGVFAARMDLNEKGGAIVDILTAPIMIETRRHGKQVAVVSTNKALQALSWKHKNRKGSHYSALNDSWAEYAQLHLDPQLVRGSPKSETGKTKLPPEIFAARAELEKDKKSLSSVLHKVEKKASSVQAHSDAFAAGVAALTAGDVFWCDVESDLMCPAELAPRLRAALPQLIPLARDINEMKKQTRLQLERAGSFLSEAEKREMESLVH
jgi:hypothetical protein